MKLSDFISVFVAASIGLSISTNAAIAVEASAKSAVNVRTGPGTSFGKVDALYAGEGVNITECQGNWCHIEHAGPDGWVSGRYLIATGGSSGGSSERSSGSRSSGGDDAVAAAILGAIIGGVLANSSSSSTPTPTPATPVATPDLPYGPDTCKPGYVWREVVPGDHVCVRPDRRTTAANENSMAGLRVNPTGSYGPNTCKSGFVWREAYSGDVVCVSPARRTQVSRENRDGSSHRVLTP